MKRIRILAALVILAFLVLELGAGAKSFSEGWEEAGDGVSIPVTLQLQPAEGAVPDSVCRPVSGTSLPCRVKSLSVVLPEAEISGWHTFFLCLSMPCGFFMLYGFYCLLRMVYAVTKGEVFSDKNVFRMRCFAYGLMLISFCMDADAWLLYRQAASLVQPAGYEVLSYSLKGEWMFYLVLALLTEIFAVGVKLKKEQELTI